MAAEALTQATERNEGLTPGILAGLVSVPVATMLIGSLGAYRVRPPLRVRCIVSAMAGGLLVGAVGFEMAPLLLPDNDGHPMRSKMWNAGVLVGLGVSLVVTTLLTILSNVLEEDEDEDDGNKDRNGNSGNDSAESEDGDNHHNRDAGRRNGRHDSAGDRLPAQTGDEARDRFSTPYDPNALTSAPSVQVSMEDTPLLPHTADERVPPIVCAERRRRHAAAVHAASAARRAARQMRERGTTARDDRRGDSGRRDEEAGGRSWLARCLPFGRGAFVNYPLGPVVLVFIDGLSDGLLTGISANVTMKQGWIIAISLAVEMTFTGAALSAILLQHKARQRTAVVTLALVPFSLYIGALGGNAAISVLDTSSPTFAGLMAFATGQIFYLATVELIGDALTMARDQGIPAFMILFDAAVLGGFFLGVSMQLLLP